MHESLSQLRRLRCVLGLTGNIATGKSTVASQLQRLGAHVFDADQVARDVVAPGTPALAEIARVFGARMLKPDGWLDRRALGAMVFQNPKLLDKLEAITHPAVRLELRLRILAAPVDEICVIEVIKLFESGWSDACRQTWVTHCPPAVQLARLMHERGLTETEAQTRIAAQNSQADKLARADVVLDTSESTDRTRAQVEHAWQAFVTKCHTDE